MNETIILRKCIKTIKMESIINLLTSYAGEIVTFVFTTLCAYFKRNYDLKQIKKLADLETHFKK